MEPTIAKIEAAEAEVGRLQGEEARMRQAAQADGTIDPDEQADLDRILEKIQQGRDIIGRMRAEYEANKAIWDGKADELATFQAQTGELTTWGEPTAAGFAASITEMASQSGAEQWKAATGALQSSQAAILAPYAEYQRQSIAKAVYDPTRADFEARLSAAAGTELRAVAIVSKLDALSKAGPTMDAKTAERDFVSAQGLLDPAMAQLVTVEAELVKLAQDRDAYLSLRADLDTRMAPIAATDFATLQSRATDLTGKVAQIDAQAAAFDFASAGTATTAAIDEAKALLADMETARLARDSYQALLTGIQTRLDTANAQGAVELAPKLEAIQAKVDGTKTMAATDDFAGASAGLEEAATDMGGFETLLAARKAYLERLAEVLPKVTERSLSTEYNTFLDADMKSMATAQTAMETAAKALDFEAALTHLNEVVVALDAIAQVIKAKQEIVAAKSAELKSRLAVCESHPYPEVVPRVAAINAAIKAAEAEATAEHFDSATKGLEAATIDLEKLIAEIQKIEADLKAEIEAIIAPVEAKLPTLEPPPSPNLPPLKKLVAGVRSRMTSSMDLLGARDDAKEAVTQAGELQKVHDVMKDIEDKWGIDQDGAAREVVDKLEKSGELKQLPMEARNYLVDKLMSGVCTEDDHKAIKKLWDDEKFVDRKFDAIDAPIRKQIISKLTSDPKIKDYESKWGTMSEDEKKEAIKYIASVPCGPDGWNIGMPMFVRVTNNGKDKDGKLPDYGGYRSGLSMLEVNVHPDSGGFDEILNTVTHEMGHRKQEFLMDGLANGSITPGDPNYDQAVALKLSAKYSKWNTFTFDGKRWDDVYLSSPEEAHSRKMGDDMQAQFNAAKDAGKWHSVP